MRDGRTAGSALWGVSALAVAAGVVVSFAFSVVGPANHAVSVASRATTAEAMLARVAHEAAPRTSVTNLTVLGTSACRSASGEVYDHVFATIRSRGGSGAVEARPLATALRRDGFRVAAARYSKGSVVVASDRSAGSWDLYVHRKKPYVGVVIATACGAPS